MDLTVLTLPFPTRRPSDLAVANRTMPMSATPRRTAWRHVDAPRIDRWIGDADVVHGTNFVVPPTRAAAVVTIHDLTYLRYPEMCKRLVLQYPQLVGRALGCGAMVHTRPEARRGGKEWGSTGRFRWSPVH